MATDISDIVKQGYLKIRSCKLGLWQRRWIVLRRASSKAPCRLEKYIDEKAARSVTGHKIALLTSVNTISRIPSSVKKHAFTICFMDCTTKCFACDSDMEADTWVKLLVQESLIPQPGFNTGEPDVLSPGIQKELQEQFHVYLMPTPKLDVFGECLLQVTHENIYLWDINNSRVKLVAWPLTALRRYGSDPSKFTFEAGRQCVTGEGMFVFHTLEGDKIYRKVHQATLAIAEAHHRMKEHNDKVLSNQDSSSQTGSSSRSVSYPSGFPESSSSYHVTEDSDDDHQEVVVSNPEVVSDHKRMVASEETLIHQIAPRPRSKCSLRSHLLQYGK
ncbi:docking protein 6 [Trichonephila clavata]|uniref:Docking protein 6 n=2 Tax=Trichonephila TaxID=2585208 RepID=A0A8X6FYT6_TRICU|nr:docking protein 6 [Trichonephila clavata]GFY37540.1 docking protein 6 [Trichonephila inaurata madagascariensis]